MIEETRNLSLPKKGRMYFSRISLDILRWISTVLREHVICCIFMFMAIRFGDKINWFVQKINFTSWSTYYISSYLSFFLRLYGL